MATEPMVRKVEGELVDEDRRETALAERPVSDLTPIDLAQFQVWAESRRKALEVLMDMGIATTSAEDWANMGGKPHPEQGACSSIINMLGIQITPPARRRENFEDEKGTYYMYILEADMTVPKFGIGPVAIVGRCSSRDPFFGMKGGVVRPASEIDPGDILAKAYTNLRFRAVKAAVPQIAGMTWDKLKALTGGRVSESKTKQVNYDKGEGEEPAAPAGTGNCPTCHKGNLIEKHSKDKTKTFWVCSEQKWNPATKTSSGCQHRQWEAPAAAPPPINAPQPDSHPSDVQGESGAEARKELLVAQQAVLELSGSLGFDVPGLVAEIKAVVAHGDMAISVKDKMGDYNIAELRIIFDWLENIEKGKQEGEEKPDPFENQ